MSELIGLASVLKINKGEHYMVEPAPAQGHYFKDWLTYIVCATIGGFIAGAILGFIFGAVGGVIAGASGHISSARDLGAKLGAIGGVLASLPVSYFVYRWTVRRVVSRLAVEKLKIE